MKFNQSLRRVRVAASDYLNDVTILNLCAKRNHPTIDAGSSARIANFRVNHVTRNQPESRLVVAG